MLETGALLLLSKRTLFLGLLLGRLQLGPPRQEIFALLDALPVALGFRRIHERSRVSLDPAASRG